MKCIRKKIVVLAVVTASSLLIPATAGAQNIAVMDVARIFEDYEMTRDLEALFEDRQRAVSKEAESRRKSIEQMRRALAAFDPTSEDFARREKDLIRAETEYQIWSGYEERRLKTEHKNWLMRIYRRTQKVVGEVARERSVDLVLTYDRLVNDAPDSGALRQQILLQKVIYHSDRVDITNEVLKRLNKQYENQGGIRSLAEQNGKPDDNAAPRTPIP